VYTTDCNYFRIINYNNVQEGYYKWTGCTGIVSFTSIAPLKTQYLLAKNVTVDVCGAPLSLIFIGLNPLKISTELCPSPTLTPTVTPTPTPTSLTPTPTPTPTITPTIPTIVYMYNLRTGGWYQNVCESVNMTANPKNVTIYTPKLFEDLEVGDYVYGNQSLTIPPIGANFTISNGGRFIQLSGNQIINVGVC
jgi:hypothetical protein